MRRRLLATVPLLLLVAAPEAVAGSLPRVSSGERPGPPLLYAKAPRVPQLAVGAPFRARPLLVSGTDAYRGGEYLYQDYLFDDHGADTGASTSRPGVGGFSQSDGDLVYPPARRYAGNAADLVELRIKPTATAVVYRVTLGAVRADDATAVGIGIDTDRSGGPAVPWPHGAGLSSPGLDRFITAWGTGGEVTALPSGAVTRLGARAVTIDRRANQMTIRLPRSLMDPKRRTWRYVAGTGLWSGSRFQRPAPGFPGVFNLAFRFNESQPRGRGSWFEAGQATTLAGATSGRFQAEVDFRRLARKAKRWIHAPGRKQARIYPSRLKLHEGVREGFPAFGGRLQPYLVTVPRSYRRTGRAGVTFALHSLSASYTQYAVFAPRQQRQLGDDAGRFHVTPLSRGPDGWYTDEAEVDFFEVWADLARRFRLDPRRVALSGYSMGGYGTYKLGLQWPDLFGAAFTTVGPPLFPGHVNTIRLVENARWLPYLNWAGRNDELVPIGVVRAQQQRFDELGLRSQLWTFAGGHVDLAAGDRWDAARAFLAGTLVQRDPRRVDYAFMPSADSKRLGLVHDHAYWVSRLRVRNRRGDPRSGPARGLIRALSSAPTRGFGRAGDQVVRRITSWNGKPPEPETVVGTEWERIAGVPPANRLRLRLENVGRARIDGRRAGLSGRRCLRMQIASDGPARVRLDLRLRRGARARHGRFCRTSAPVARNVALRQGGATFRAPSGTHSWVILAG
jgi:dienelactone hydrolase